MSNARQNLPTLKAMLALCSEARAETLRDIKRDAEARQLRWRRDRERMLWAIDRNGHRLNGEDFLVWNRTKAQVAELLAKHPEAVEIVCNGGIDIAENLADMEAGNYDTHDWGVTLWSAAPAAEQGAESAAPSDAEIDALIASNTAFRNMDDLLSAGGRYRPSLDCSDPDMLAIANRYDELQKARGDDRRAYRYRCPTAA
ncbi:MAG TPA: hypothetical protein VFE72_07450 [Lysobacter sp.]|nr:hypothetical protein [Lysobacter sp.]